MNKGSVTEQAFSHLLPYRIRVFLAVCLLILLWLLMSCILMQRSLQWWHQRQSVQLCQEAELIRDGLLQETFAMRRSLELALLTKSDSASGPDEAWLGHLERFQRSLEGLSNQLSPPYLADCLPLAIQQTLAHWQQDVPDVQLKLELPSDWRLETVESGRVILTSLNELLRITLLPPMAKTVLHISLVEHGKIGELAVQFDTPPGGITLSDPARQELEYLRQSFQALTAGRCYCQRRDFSLTWHFRWRSHPVQK